MLALFSPVAGDMGSPDTCRDVRVFSLKFYTGEGNYDLVGNNTPRKSSASALSAAEPAVTPATISTPNIAALMPSAIHSTRRQAVSCVGGVSSHPPQHPPAISSSCLVRDDRCIQAIATIGSSAWH